MITLFDGEDADVMEIPETNTNNDYQELSEKYQALELKYKELEDKYSSLLSKYEELKSAKSKAGRRPNDEKWTAKYQAFSRLKAAGYKREQIQEELNMSRATFFRYNKIYGDGGEFTGAEPEPEAPKAIPEGLVLDPSTGEYVTPEGLRRRRKLAEIRARRAAEEQQNG